MKGTLDFRQLVAELAHQLLLAHESFSVVCKDGNVSCSQLTVLKRLSEVDELCCKTLSADLKIVPSTLTGICNVLEKKGYITRQYSAVDKRRVYVSLTDSGQSYLKHAYDSIIDCVNRVAKTFDQSDIEKSTVLLQSFNQKVNAKTI